jgi:arylamine N-acetyltransferase
MAHINRNEPVADDVPWSEKLTNYDQTHLVVYLRLLDAEADGATEEEMSRIVLGIDPDHEPDRAHRVLERHLERARWMTQVGYRRLLEQ